MKFAILLSLVACTLGAPSLPRLPLRVLLNGDAPLEGSSVGIVGGQFMLPFELPFLVSVQFESFSGFSHGCGGSVYNKDFIVDAAHCFPGVDPSQVRVVASEYLLSWNSGLEQIRSVKKINMHPKYDSKTNENDIAMLELATPLDFSTKRVAPIQLGKAPVAAGTDVTVAGWGTLSSGGRSPVIPRKVTVPVVSNADCNRMYDQENIVDSMLCAGFSAGGKDSCQGDSGGPLFTSNPFTLVGVVSWGYGCADGKYPGVYTRVSEYIAYIEGIAGKQ